MTGNVRLTTKVDCWFYWDLLIGWSSLVFQMLINFWLVCKSGEIWLVGGLLFLLDHCFDIWMFDVWNIFEPMTACQLDQYQWFWRSKKQTNKPKQSKKQDMSVFARSLFLTFNFLQPVTACQLDWLFCKNDQRHMDNLGNIWIIWILSG